MTVWRFPPVVIPPHTSQVLLMGIASVCHGNITRSQGEMLERFAGVDIADQHLDKLQGQQVHRDMQAMIGAFGAWRLNTAGVDNHRRQFQRSESDGWFGWIGDWLHAHCLLRVPGVDIYGR